MQDLRRELKNAKRGTIVKLPEGNEGISEDQAFKLPIQSEEELKNLEILLQDENIRIKMVRFNFLKRN